MDMQALAEAETDGTNRRSKIPDVRPFNRRRDDEQRSRLVVASIVTKTPMGVRSNSLVRAFDRVLSKGTNDIALGTANNVAHIKLSKSV
jgi:hypothetical protein